MGCVSIPAMLMSTHRQTLALPLHVFATPGALRPEGSAAVDFAVNFAVNFVMIRRTGRVRVIVMVTSAHLGAIHFE